MTESALIKQLAVAGPLLAASRCCLKDKQNSRAEQQPSSDGVLSGLHTPRLPACLHTERQSVQPLQTTSQRSRGEGSYAAFLSNDTVLMLQGSVDAEAGASKSGRAYKIYKPF